MVETGKLPQNVSNVRMKVNFKSSCHSLSLVYLQAAEVPVKSHQVRCNVIKEMSYLVPTISHQVQLKHFF